MECRWNGLVDKRCIDLVGAEWACWTHGDKTGVPHKYNAGTDTCELEVVDCVHSPWSMWGPHPRQCNRVYNQTRRRSIRTQPQNGGTECGELLQRRRQPGPRCR